MKTLVAIPCMDMIHTKFIDALITSLMYADAYDIRFGASSLVYDTRNSFITQAIDQEYDRILWIDSDMTFAAEDVAYLSQDLDNGYDFVTGLCFKRRPPYTPCIFQSLELNTLDNGLKVPRAKVYEDYPKDKLFEVAACGAGMMMTSVSGLNRVAEQYGRWLFMPISGFGEDLSFCYRLKMAGERIYCDSRTEIGHVGDYVYDARMYERHRKETRQ